ncbi:MAG: ABC transporter permease [Pirellulales bacterium]|nr:ABC transporter permease [Pirellulales bacterium]
MSAGSQLVSRWPVGRNELGLAATIVMVVALTAAFDSSHNYWHNPWPSAVDITRQVSLLGIFALGSAIVIISGGIDLSCGSVIVFSGTVCGSIMLLLAPEAMKTSEPVGGTVIAAAIAGSLLAGFLIGSLHAWLITVVGLPPFVATLATLVGLRSLSRSVVDKVTASVFPYPKAQIDTHDETFRYLATSIWIPALVLLVLAAVAWLILSRTVLGRHLYALGGNEEAARLSGIRTDRLKWFAYCAGAMTSALAGVFYVSSNSSVEPQTLGRGYELNAIAAAVVGGCSLQGGVGTVPGTVLGVVFLRVVIDAVAKIIKVGADVYEGMIVGTLVVLAVALSGLRVEGRTRKEFFPGALGFVAGLTLALLAGVVAALLAGQQAGTATLVVATSSLIALRLWERRGARRALP